MKRAIWLRPSSTVKVLYISQDKFPLSIGPLAQGTPPLSSPIYQECRGMKYRDTKDRVRKEKEAPDSSGDETNVIMTLKVTLKSQQ